jgi:hypothetical protein
MSQKLSSAIAVIGIDIGKNSFHIVGHDQRSTSWATISAAQSCCGRSGHAAR